ncbi:hypothetical protein DLJ49_16415 [Rhodovulum sp. 12E13]|uniref:hypothetical protein n=1 Tax=Rhodovulum sp. 12E13 TaxID=2203891 RepID=UPI000E160302|nr:hypothetical protein [Rhodovulum sp. 12E13]RDC71106.1 hypothetical protein DLJ49_16415 [Rhodovulum sp. 12E13]
MTIERFTDETLMAYADGELDAETARAVAAAEAADGAVARRIALFHGTRAALSEARDARPAPEVPDALVARVRETLEQAGAGGEEPGRVVPLVRRAPSRPWVPVAVAASLALAVGLGAGLSLRPATGPDIDLATGPQPGATGLAALEASGVAGALSRLASGGSEQVAAGEVTIIASFRTPEGTLCREFELATGSAETVAVACAEGAAWDLRFAVASGRADGAGYAPAGALEALDTWLSGIGAGAPLPEDEERAALGRLAE